MAPGKGMRAPYIRAAHDLILSDHIKVLIEDLTACTPYAASTANKAARHEEQELRNLALRVLKMPMGTIPPFVVSHSLVKDLKALITDHFTKPQRRSIVARLPPDVLMKLVKSFGQLISKIDRLSSKASDTVTDRDWCRYTSSRVTQARTTASRKDVGGDNRVQSLVGAKQHAQQIKSPSLLSPEGSATRGRTQLPGGIKGSFSAHLTIKLTSSHTYERLRVMESLQMLSRIHIAFKQARKPFHLKSSTIWFMNPALTEDRHLVIQTYALHPEDLVVLQENIAWVRPALKNDARFEQFRRDHIKAASLPVCDASLSDNYVIKDGRRLMPVISYQAQPQGLDQDRYTPDMRNMKPVPGTTSPQASMKTSIKISTAVSDRLVYFEPNEPRSSTQGGGFQQGSEMTDEPGDAQDLIAEEALTLRPNEYSDIQTDHSPAHRGDQAEPDVVDTLKKEPGDGSDSTQYVKQEAEHQNDGHRSTSGEAANQPAPASTNKGKSRADVPLIVLDDDGLVIEEELIDPSESHFNSRQMSRLSIHSGQHESNIPKDTWDQPSRESVRPRDEDEPGHNQPSSEGDITVAALLANPEVFAGLCSSQTLIARLLAEAGKNLTGEQGKRARDELIELMPVETPTTKRLRRG